MVQDGDYYTDDGKALQLKGTEVSFALSFVVPGFFIRRRYRIFLPVGRI